MNVQTNSCNNNQLILDVKQLNKIVKFYCCYTLKALWDGQGKIKMYYVMSKVENLLSEKRSVFDFEQVITSWELCSKIKHLLLLQIEGTQVWFHFHLQ